jgi:DNA-binding CsgD family transcriptional regulator
MPNMPMPGSNLQKSRTGADKAKASSWPTVMGFVVADASFAPLFANQEAIAILSYPGTASYSLVEVLQKKIRPGLANAQLPASNHNGHTPVLELKSGRRTYTCRAFPLARNGRTSSTATMVVLERANSNPLSLSRLSQRFHLTHREQQAVALLLQGLSNKEMAENMGISANTVKAFLRMATIKMGASSRSGIVTKILDTLLSNGYFKQIQFDAMERTPDA